jgi:ATP-binding cassette subfamily B protein
MILLIGISNILVIYIGGKQYLNGEIENIGIIAEFIIYVNMLTWPVASLGWISSIIQQAEASQKRINEFLKEKSEIKSNINGLKKINGSIEFKDVSFTYTDSNIKAIDKISLKLNNKKSLGIVGVTGSGKTTLIKLLTKSFNIDSGEILFDNNSIDEFDLECLRKEIGVVSQDSFLFSDSIINNIRFGKEKASLTEVEKVCKISGIHDEIIKFSNGYETILGERGINLSGGQKQRICIARALIKEPKILILDDCLSALDTETEEKIILSLKSLLSNTTTIITSHRLSSVQNQNEIIVLNKGKIIQKGNHNLLIKQNGYYKEVYTKQLTKKDDKI